MTYLYYRKLPPPKPSRRSPRIRTPEHPSPPLSRLGVTMDAQVETGNIQIIRDNSLSRSLDHLHIYDELQKAEVQPVEPDASLVFAASLGGHTSLPTTSTSSVNTADDIITSPVTSPVPTVSDDMSFISLSEAELSTHQTPSSDMIASAMNDLTFDMVSKRDLGIVHSRFFYDLY